MSSVLDAKRKYKNVYILRFEKDHHAVFRLLPWGEFKSCRRLVNILPAIELELEEDILKTCLIEYVSPQVKYKIGDLTEEDEENGWVPFDFACDFFEGGAIATVFSCIWKLSGASNPEQLIEDIAGVRTVAERQVENRIISAICAVTKYKPEDFDSMQWPDIIELIAQGELMLAGVLPPVPFKLLDE
jgi:hypothetical protein